MKAYARCQNNPTEIKAVVVDILAHHFQTFDVGSQIADVCGHGDILLETGYSNSEALCENAGFGLKVNPRHIFDLLGAVQPAQIQSTVDVNVGVFGKTFTNPPRCVNERV